MEIKENYKENYTICTGAVCLFGYLLINQAPICPLFMPSCGKGVSLLNRQAEYANEKSKKKTGN